MTIIDRKGFDRPKTKESLKGRIGRIIEELGIKVEAKRRLELSTEVNTKKTLLLTCVEEVEMVL